MAFSIKDQKDSNAINEVVSTAVLTDNYVTRGDGGVRGIQTSLVLLSDAGTVTIPNIQSYKFLDYAGTGTLNAFTGTVNDEVDVGVTLNIGGIEFEEDAGYVTRNDMPVSSSSADGTRMAYVDKIDGNNVFEIGAFSDGPCIVTGKQIGRAHV